ncbi:MAG TPA: hypothetical protein VL282_11845 [Tepidisphaeraceae bacterium]|jgi:hypothetical protein|nr:hypothetical protein [Tepidisphaeraceae bacterium]
MADDNDNPFFEGLQTLPAWVRWPAVVLRAIFGVSATVGFFVFLVHLVVFFTAFHYGASAPTGAQTYRIADHGDSAYVTYGVHECIGILEIAMLIGLGGGVAGLLAVDAWVRWIQTRSGR